MDERTRRAVDEVVAAAPPLSPGQVQDLVRLLGPAVEKMRQAAEQNREEPGAESGR